jgi:protein-S-isoprenylcysteine O-methyltransferase Ste14
MMAFKRKRKDLIFVGIQLLLFIGYVLIPALVNILANQTTRTIGLTLLIIGTGIFLVGLFQLRKSLTPFPSVRPDAHLVTIGIYRFIRHPVYTGIMSSLLGYGLYQAHAGKLIIVALLAILFYFKSKYEEEMLQKAYPDYEQYSRYAGRFLPKMKIIFNCFEM